MSAAISSCSARPGFTLKLSRAEPGQYLDGRPPGKTRLLLEEVLVRPAGGAHPAVCVGPNAPVLWWGHYTVKQKAPSFGWDVKLRSWLSVVIKNPRMSFKKKSRGVIPTSWPNSPTGLWPSWPPNNPHIYWLASSLCLVVSVLTQYGCRRIIQVDAVHWWWLRRYPHYYIKHFECLEKRYIYIYIYIYICNKLLLSL